MLNIEEPFVIQNDNDKESIHSSEASSQGENEKENK